MDEKERNAQKAVGLEKQFDVSIVLPIKATINYRQEVKAVSEEDAKKLVIQMLKMKTNRQLSREVQKDNNLRNFDFTINEDNKSVIHEIRMFVEKDGEQPTGSFTSSMMIDKNKSDLDFYY